MGAQAPSYSEDDVKYKAINRDDGTVYLVAIPDEGSDSPTSLADEVILELSAKLEKVIEPDWIACLRKCIDLAALIGGLNDPDEAIVEEMLETMEALLPEEKS